MNIIEAGEAIKQTVTMDHVLPLYGCTVNRAGFMRCPFHAGDHTASLKVYKGGRGWACFGCHKGGSVLDFVMAQDNCSYADAVRALDSRLELRLLRVEHETVNSFMMRKVDNSKAMAAYKKHIAELRRLNNFNELLLDIRWLVYYDLVSKPKQEITADEWTIIAQEEEQAPMEWAEHYENRRKEEMTFYAYQHKDDQLRNAERAVREADGH